MTTPQARCWFLPVRLPHGCLVSFLFQPCGRSNTASFLAGKCKQRAKCILFSGEPWACLFFINNQKKKKIKSENGCNMGPLNLHCFWGLQGVHHLKHLERLILCSNTFSIPSLKELTELSELSELSALRELDLRLNPLTRSDSHYRLHLVHTLSSPHKLGQKHAMHIVVVSVQFPA